MPTMPTEMQSVPCSNCGNEKYRILGVQIFAGKVSIQHPLCTNCNAPLKSVSSDSVPIVGEPAQDV